MSVCFWLQDGKVDTSSERFGAVSVSVLFSMVCVSLIHIASYSHTSQLAGVPCPFMAENPPRQNQKLEAQQQPAADGVSIFPSSNTTTNHSNMTQCRVLHQQNRGFKQQERMCSNLVHKIVINHRVQPTTAFAKHYSEKRQNSSTVHQLSWRCSDQWIELPTKGYHRDTWL